MKRKGKSKIAKPDTDIILEMKSLNLKVNTKIRRREENDEDGEWFENDEDEVHTILDMIGEKVGWMKCVALEGKGREGKGREGKGRAW